MAFEFSDLFGGAPEDIEVTYPEATETEKQLASMQLDVVNQLGARIGDPNVKEMIYESLPYTDMNNKDLAKYTLEVGKIKKEVTEMNLTLATRAYGRNIDDMVASGQISKETGAGMKIQNQAAVGAMQSIYNKKLDAARINMARSAFLQENQFGLQKAGVLGEINSMNERMYGSALGSLTSWYQKDRAAKLGMAGTVAESNLKNNMMVQDMNMEFISNLAAMGGSKYGQIKADQKYNDLVKSLGLDSTGAEYQTSTQTSGDFGFKIPDLEEN